MHKQVSVAECLNHMKIELARAMLFDSGLPTYLWDKAIHHAIWIKNQAPTKALGSTPYKAHYHEKPSLAGLVLFGTQVWVKIVNARKLKPQAKLSYFVGYDDESTGYWIYYPEGRSVSIECKVVFDQGTFDDTVTVKIEGLAEDGQ